MKGVYLNIGKPNVLANQVLATNLLIFDLCNYSLDGFIVYSKSEWSSQPYFKVNDEEFFVGGWFQLYGVINDIETLADLYKKNKQHAFSEIEAGNFVIIKKKADKISIINDLVGLSTHYYFISKEHNGLPIIRVAPSLTLLERYTEIDCFFKGILSSQGHLFDNYTCLKDVFRLNPASELTADGNCKAYSKLGNTQSMKNLTDVPSLIKNVVDPWPKKKRALAISGGLDSRLMLASSEYSYGYTYGPDNSGDRVIARVFKSCFDNYYEYSIQDAMKSSKRRSDECRFFFNHASSWLPGLLEAYGEARSHAGDADILFDGYLGDVFQRGNYLRFGGFVGSIFKMIPVLYKLPITAKYLIKKRYFKLNNVQFLSLWQSFQERTNGLLLNDYQKVTYYELFYGRGGRYVVNGGNITANQLFTVIPVFMSKSMLELLLKSDLADAVSYKNLPALWCNVEDKYKQLRADSGISPNTSPIIAPFVNVGYRFLLHYAPWMGNYGDEIKKIKK
jgi:hypothetical protein